MKSWGILFSLFAVCLITWTASVAISTRAGVTDHQMITSFLVVGIPALFTIAMAVVGTRRAHQKKPLLRCLTGLGWSAAFATLCWFAFFLLIVPTYFHFGGTL